MIGGSLVGINVGAPFRVAALTREGKEEKEHPQEG
jgi:hypothetical protein